MKVIVVGCTHAGTAVANQVFKTHPDTDLTIYEKNDNVSFLSCGIALYLGGRVKDPQGLFYSSPEMLSHIGAHVKMKHEVLKVNSESKTVTVKNLNTGDVFEDSYDKLVITTGSWPVIPKINGIHDDHVYLCKNYDQAKELFNVAKKANKIVVIGGGYIGVELVEAYANQGKDVTLIDALPRMLSKYFDKNYTDKIEKDFKDHGAHLALGQKVKGFCKRENGVVVQTDKGNYDADIAILCIGFKPNTSLLNGIVDMDANGAIKINDYMQTSNPDIYGAGDAVAVHYNPTGKDAYIPLATNAVRQGTLVGYNLFGNKMKYMGTQSTSGLELFGKTIVSSGLTLEHAKQEGIKVDSVTIQDNYRPEFMPTTTPVLMTLVWNVDTHQILGGQLMSKYDVSQSANALSICIQNKNTIEFLSFVDMLFQPNFDRPFNYLNILGQAAMDKANRQ